MRQFLALVLLLAAAGPGAAADRHLVLITIDGLRPVFYLDDGWDTPHLRGLLRAGAHARAVEPAFPSATYPGHASIATGVRPARHGIAFNKRFDPATANGSWYAEAAALRATPIWEWARSGGLSTAAVFWPTTLGARIDTLVPEQDYYDRVDPLPLLVRASTPGLFGRLGVTLRPEMFKDVIAWDAFLAETAAAVVRADRPRLLLLHLVEPDYAQHRHPLDSDAVRAAVRRADGHVGTVLSALTASGLADDTVVMVSGDHGFAAIRRVVSPNHVLTRAGLRACPWDGGSWRATAHVTGASAAIFVSPPGDPDTVARAAAALEADAPGHYRFISREELDRMGALPNAAVFAIEAAAGYGLSLACDRGLVGPATGGTHGLLPARPEMATGFVAAGPGVRAGAVLDRMRLIDVAPTAARLLGLTPPPVDGRVLDDILK